MRTINYACPECGASNRTAVYADNATLRGSTCLVCNTVVEVIVMTSRPDSPRVKVDELFLYMERKL